MKFNKILTFVLVGVLMVGCLSINAFAEDNTFLDLEESATYSNTKDLDQNYTFTQSGDSTYTDVTKVKLEWAISDIAATYTSNKTWNPDTLAWEETKTISSVADKTATFTLTNYSSTKVVGTVSFNAETALKDTLASATFDDNNGKEIDTVVNSDYTIDETKKANVPSNTITATLKFNADKFANLAATSSATKYGTYTVTIREYSFGAQYKYEINQLAKYMNMDGNHLQRLLLDWASDATNRNKTYTDLLSGIETKDDALCASAIYILGIEHFMVNDSSALMVFGKEFSKGILNSDVLFKRINIFFNMTNDSTVSDSDFINGLPSYVLSPMNDELLHVNEYEDIPVCDIYDALKYSIDHAEEESSVGNTYTLAANAIYKLLNIYSNTSMSLDDVKASMNRMIAKAENETILDTQVLATFANATDEIKQQTAYDYAIYCYMCMFGLMSGDSAYTALSEYYTTKEFTSLDAIGYVLGDDYLFKCMAQIHEALQSDNVAYIMATSYSQLSGNLISGIYTNYTDNSSDMFKAIAKIFED